MDAFQLTFTILYIVLVLLILTVIVKTFKNEDPVYGGLEKTKSLKIGNYLAIISSILWFIGVSILYFFFLFFDFASLAETTGNDIWEQIAIIVKVSTPAMLGLVLTQLIVLMLNIKVLNGTSRAWKNAAAIMTMFSTLLPIPGILMLVGDYKDDLYYWRQEMEGNKNV